MKTVIIGAGGIANAHARAWQKLPNIELAVYDRDYETARAFADRYRTKVFESLENAFEYSEVVDICTPTVSHSEIALSALNHRKHVFVEKPMALSLEEAYRMIQTATNTGMCLMPGHVVRFFPQYQAANRYILDGKIGDPAAIRLSRGGKMPGGSENWFKDFSKSGGILLDLALHDFDFIRWTFGEIESVVSKSVSGKGGTGPDCALTILKLASGAVAHVESNWLDQEGFSTSYDIAGSKGLITHSSREKASLKVSKSGGSKVFEMNLLSHEDPFALQISAFHDSIINSQPPPVTMEDGFHALSISLAAIQSAKTGCRVAPMKLSTVV